MVENVETIQAAVEDAANAFVIWQKTHIGADINTDMLTEFLRAAGAKRAPISKPTYTAIGNTEIAVAKSVTILYGGLEDD